VFLRWLLTIFTLQIGVEELRKKIVARYPAALKLKDADGVEVLQANPHPAALLAKLTQY
jgi:hypothetical protein